MSAHLHVAASMDPSKDIYDVLVEISRISALLDPTTSEERVIKKARFLAYELNTLVPATSTDQTKLIILNQFFFEQKKFTYLLAPAVMDQTRFLLLPKVLSERSGSPTVLTLLYAWLAKQIGLSLEFVDVQPACFLKLVDKGISHFIDLSKNGRILDNHELLEHINLKYQEGKAQATALLETVPPARLIVEYLNGLKKIFAWKDNIEALLIIQNSLIKYQPSNLSLLGERALLYKKIGQLREALADLKRYFAFTDRSKSIDLYQIYEDLLKRS